MVLVMVREALKKKTGKNLVFDQKGGGGVPPDQTLKESGEFGNKTKLSPARASLLGLSLAIAI